MISCVLPVKENWKVVYGLSARNSFIPTKTDFCLPCDPDTPMKDPISLFELALRKLRVDVWHTHAICVPTFTPNSFLQINSSFPCTSLN